MSSKFRNPIIWEDLPDPEVFRVGDIYYMSASSFHFSPGAPVLRSYDLVNWEYIGHSVPELPPSSRFSLDGKRPAAYGKGVWASTMKYRESNGLFYFYTPIQGTDKTYISTAKSPSDTWTAHPPIESFYYDLGLLIDDDDTMYIAHGTKNIQVAQLTPDGLNEVVNKIVYVCDDYDEGARMYKIQGAYYIWLTKRGKAQSVLKSTAGPFGPYEYQDVISDMRSPAPGTLAPHQGGLVDTPDGRWYFMAFTDAVPAGRIPLLAPISFDEQGWPSVVAEYLNAEGQWLLEYPLPVPEAPVHPSKTTLGRHDFKGPQLEPCWQWNHNPDNSKWRLEDGHLRLETATVTQSHHLAANTLTLRTVGPGSIATFCLDTSNMRNGDRAGVCLLREASAYIGIHRDAEESKLVFVNGAKVGPRSVSVAFMNGRPVALDWELISNGTVEAEASLTSHQVWLRVKADLRALNPEDCEHEIRHATFEYSYDGEAFTQLGGAFSISKDWVGFVGNRFGVFNFATLALGGSIRASHAEVEVWEPTS